MTTTDTRLTGILANVEAVVAASPVLQATKHVVSTTERGVAVEVEGSHYEARAWRHAFDGRILPSHIDVHGVRTQLVICTSLEIQVIDRSKRGA